MLQSFAFLGEAVNSHPTTRVLVLSSPKVPSPFCYLINSGEVNDRSDENVGGGSRGEILDTSVKGGGGCETIVACMGLWTLFKLEYPEGATRDGYERKEPHGSLQTLLELVSSTSSLDFVQHDFSKWN